MPRRLALLLVLLACACGDNPDSQPSDGCEYAGDTITVDRFGGSEQTAFRTTGFFRSEKLCGRWWLVTPVGHPFFSVGVNSLGYGGNAGKDSGVDLYKQALDATYASPEEWAAVAEQRLRSWGFNTVGSWSDYDRFAPTMPFTINLRLSGGDWLTGDVADYFDPAWETNVIDRVAELATPWIDNSNLIGYFIDNEVRWGPDWRGQETLLQLYLGLPADAPGKAVAVDFLITHVGSVATINTTFGTSFSTRDDMLAATEGWSIVKVGSSELEPELTSGFLTLAATAYFTTTTSAIRSVDSNHMVLGNREISVITRPEVLDISAPLVDVLSANNYVFVAGVAEAARTVARSLDPGEWFSTFNERVDKPILITEFGFRADDSGLPNSWPPIYPTYKTQSDRTEAFDTYVTAAQATPWIVGYHWFRWVDQPAEGRFDGEDNNWGLVDESDTPYPLLTERMSQVNPAMWNQLRVPINVPAGE